MDGSFLDLNGERMKVEVDEFFQEIYKIQKVFQQKQKKVEQTRDNLGIVKKQYGEEDETKQKSPSVVVCSRVIEQMKEFVVHQTFLPSVL